MKSQPSIGLVVEGNATSSLVLRMPSLEEELGPVKARALRVARRLANFLRAGYGVNEYEELQPSRLILLRVPDAAAPRIVQELCASELVLKNVSFVLCESWLSATVMGDLQSRGAFTATLVPVRSQRKRWYVLEGQLTAVRQVRRFLERNDARAFELRPGTKPLYFAAQMLATDLPLSLLAAAQQALRKAGIAGNRLQELLEEMSVEMFRSFSNGARFTLSGARTDCPREIRTEYLARLRSDYPQVAALLDAQIKLASEPSVFKASAKG